MLIGASIRYGNFHPNLLHYAHHEQLEVANAAFFCVNPDGTQARSRPQTNAYMAVSRRSPAKPKTLGVFAGALQYSRLPTLVADPYHPVDHEDDRRGGTDAKQDLNSPSWDKVRGFAREFWSKNNSDVIPAARALRQPKRLLISRRSAKKVKRLFSQNSLVIKRSSL